MATLKDMRAEAGLISCEGFSIQVRSRGFSVDVVGAYCGNCISMSIDYVDAGRVGVWAVNKVWLALLCHNFDRVDYA